jgi:organic radical activating enzyme
MKLPIAEQSIRINNQEPERPTDSEYIDVVKVFYTIQGEGPFAGTPAIFVRMAGCDLQCRLCDADYTSNRKEYQVKELGELIKQKAKKHGSSLVVFTGGEPFRQKSLIQITEELLPQLDIQIETNGTLFLPLDFQFISIVCSPKTPKVNSNLVPEIDAYKYVVSQGGVDKEDGLPISVLGQQCRVARPPWNMEKYDVFIQPADEQDKKKNAQNVKEAVRICLKHGYRLCLQTQKLVGLE